MISHGNNASRQGVLSPVLVLLLLLALPMPGFAAVYYRPSNCTTECDEQHKCSTAVCRETWDGCTAENTVQVSTRLATDVGNCSETECSWGGCGPGTDEVSSKVSAWAEGGQTWKLFFFCMRPASLSLYMH